MHLKENQVKQEEIDRDYYLSSNLPYWIWKAAHYLSKYHIPLLPFMLQQILRIFLSCCLPYKTRMGRNVHFAHNGLGTVVHPDCVIGDDVMIYTGVTLGASQVGNRVQIFTGAKVIKMVKIGSNVKIGANAVVLCDLPDNCTAVGVPARIIKR
jgi:serine O-acetyltransferase